MPKKLAKIFHFDSFGKRQEKYDRLNNTEFSEVKWNELNPKEPYYFFVPKDFKVIEKYQKGIKLDELFDNGGPGTSTERDKIVVNFTIKKPEKVINDFKDLSIGEIYLKYSTKDSRDWQVGYSKKDLFENKDLIPKNFITKYPIDGDNLVEKIKYENEKVFINDEQYFEGINENIWNF